MEPNTELPTLLYSSENKKLQDLFEIAQKKFVDKCEPPEWLLNAESPFKWMMALSFDLVLDCNTPDKLKDYKNQGPQYGFEKICYLLTLLFMNSWVYERSRDSSSDSEEEGSSNELDNKNKGEDISEDEYPPEKAYSLCRKALDEMANHEGDVMYLRIGAALEHVLAATRAHMLYREGDIAASQEIAKNLQPITDMTVENQAGIEGIKGRFILSFYKDVRKALEASLKAKEMDPTFGMWYYQSAKIIRRRRREFKEDMVEEEIEYFEKAVALERNPKFLVFLAQAYREKSWFILINNPGDRSIDELQRKAGELYRECWTLQKDSATICRRIGNGMMKLRDKYQDLELARKALKKSIDICENYATVHQLGVLFYKFDKDDEAAFECFQKVKQIFGTADLIHMMLIKDPSYDPADLIEYWRKICITLSKRDILYCEIGWYYLFFKDNLTMSVRYFWSVLRRDFNSFRVMEFESFAFCVKWPINMLKVVVNEIMLLKKKTLPPDHEEDMNFLDAFLQKVYEKHPDMREMELRPDLKQSIKDKVDRDIAFLRRKRYGQYNTKQTVKETEGSWRKQESHQSDKADQDKYEKNWRREDGQGSSDVNNKFSGVWRSPRNHEPVTTSHSSGSRGYERNFKGDSWNVRGQDGFHANEGTRSNSYQERSRRQFNSYNNSRYDVTVTDWRSENRSKEN